MSSNPPDMCKRFIQFIGLILEQRKGQRTLLRTDDDFQQLGLLILCGIAFINRKCRLCLDDSINHINCNNTMNELKTW